MHGQKINTISLIQSSWDVLKSDKSMMIFPLLSFISMILVFYSFADFVTLSESRTYPADFYLKLGGFYFINYFIITFFNVGLTSCVLRRLNNESSTFQDGILDACKKVHLILGWALFSASIGVMLRVIEDRLGWFGKLITGIFGIAFSLACYLMIPIMVAENKGPFAALKESAELFEETWGNQIKGEIGMGLYFLLFSLPAILLLVLGITTFGQRLSMYIVLGLLYLMILCLVQATLNAVYRSALYVYSTTGEAPKGFGTIELISDSKPGLNSYDEKFSDKLHLSASTSTMSTMNKDKVYEVYDEIINWFDDARTKSLMELKYLNLIVNTIPHKGSILDLGCGTGEPIAQFFIEKGFKITGVDGSPKMIELCKKRFPNENWIVSDMRTIILQQQFDAILAWHSFFHLDHDSQRNMFKIFKSHIKPGGVLAFTSGEEEGEIWSDNGGQQLYHASLSTAEYNSLLHEASFKVLVHKVCDPECGEATVWVAQKI